MYVSKRSVSNADAGVQCAGGAAERWPLRAPARVYLAPVHPEQVFWAVSAPAPPPAPAPSDAVKSPALSARPQPGRALCPGEAVQGCASSGRGAGHRVGVWARPPGGRAKMWCPPRLWGTFGGATWRVALVKARDLLGEPGPGNLTWGLPSTPPPGRRAVLRARVTVRSGRCAPYPRWPSSAWATWHRAARIRPARPRLHLATPALPVIQRGCRGSPKPEARVTHHAWCGGAGELPCG